MTNIVVKLPADRTQPGTLTLTLDGGAQFTWPCLGKADNLAAADHNNASRDPTLPYGDTPLGIYDVTRADTPSPPRHDMGTTVIWLDRPIAGDAVTAAHNGRTGLAIHAGRGNDRLVPTNGCVRMLDKDIDALFALATAYNSVTIAAA